MALNVEIKASVTDWRALRAQVAALSDAAGECIVQEDTFFYTPRGRLKLRLLAEDHGQLVYYERADAAGPKASQYTISTTSEPATLRDVLAQALGVRGVVSKRRWLYMIGQTRVHLDRVAGLGDFLEFEVVLQPGQSVEAGQAIAEDLMAQLGISPQQLITGAYMDLLEAQAEEVA